MVSQDLYYYLEQGDNYALMKKWDNAISSYQKAYDLDPENLEVAKLLVKMYFEKGDKEGFHKTKQTYKSLKSKLDVKVKSSHGLLITKKLDEVHIKKARTLILERKWTEAIEEYYRALQVNPENKEVRKKLIEMFLNRKKYQEALDEYINLIKLLKSKESYDEAVETAKKALFDFPKNEHKSEIHCQLGLIYMFLKKTYDTITEFRKAVSYNNNHVMSHRCLALLYTERGMYDEAVGEYQEVLRISPNEGTAYENLAEIFIREEKVESAVSWYLKAADIYTRRDKFQEALYIYDKILALKKERDIETLLKIANLHERLNNIEELIPIYEELIALYEQQQLIDRVIKIYERLVELAFDKEEYKDRLIKLYRQIQGKNLPDVELHYKLISVLEKKNAVKEIFLESLLLADTFMERGYYSEATKIYWKLLENTPDNFEIYLKLRQLYEEIGEEERVDEIDELIKNKQQTVALPIKKEVKDKKLMSLIEKEPLLAEPYSYAKPVLPDNIVITVEKPAPVSLPTKPPAKTKKEVFLTSKMKKDAVKPVEPIESIELLPIVKEKEIAFEPAFDDRLAEKPLKEYTSPYKPLVLGSSSPVELIEKMLREVSFNPTNKTNLFHLAEAYTYNENYSKAVETFERILKLDLEEITSREKIAQLKILQGKSLESISYYTEVMDIYQQQGYLDDALKTAKTIISFDPANIDVLEKMSELYIMKGQLQKALTNYIFLITLYTQKGLLRKAIQKCHKAIELNQDNIALRKKLTSLYLGQSLFSKATQELLVIANIYLKRDFTEEAIATYQYMIELQPNHLELGYKLGELYLRLNRIPEAKREFKKLLADYLEEGMTQEAFIVTKVLFELAGETYEELFSLADLFFEKKAYDEAVNIYQKIINMARKDDDEEELVRAYNLMISSYQKELKFNEAGNTAYLLASYYHEKGQTDEALGFYNQAMSAYEFSQNIVKHQETQKLIAYILWQEKADRKQAIREFKRLLALYRQYKNITDLIEPYQILAQLYLDEGKIKKSTEAYQQIVNIYLEKELTEQASDVYLLIANILSEAHQEDELVRVYEKILEISPYNINILEKHLFLLLKKKMFKQATEKILLLINIYDQMDHLDQVERVTKQAMETLPKPEKIYSQVAGIYFLRKLYHQAAIYYTRLLEFNPDNTEARYQNALIYAYEGKLFELIREIKVLLRHGLATELINLYAQRMEYNLDKGTIYHNKGIIYHELGFYCEAVNEFAQAATYHNREFAAKNMLAVCFLESGFFNLAIREWESLLETEILEDETAVELWYNLGLAYEKTGKRKKAKNAYMEAYAINIKYKDVGEKLKSLK